MSDLNKDLFNLAMSDEALPLIEAVKKHIAENVEPITEEFFALDKQKTDRWSWDPRQLELLEGAKNKAKAAGLWNFFLPDAENGEGLTNLDYAYIAAELGKYPLASESLNCSAPDTGNMEVLERVGTPEQKEQWLKPLLNGEIRSAYAMTEPGIASSDAKNISTMAVLDGDEWVINGEKYYISGAGDPRCKIMIAMVKTSPDAPPHPAAVADPRADGHPRGEGPRGRCTCSATTTRRTATCTSGSTTCGCRRRTSCSAKAAASRSPRCASARAASITACAPSARPNRRSN